LRRTALLGAAAAALLYVMVPAAHAKGAKEISVSGPKLATFTITGETRTGQFATISGFWGQAFETTPDPTTKQTTASNLGPRYVARYLMAAPGVHKTTVVQEIYPYATPQPQTHLAAGQRALGTSTKGGWYRADDELVAYLKSHGLPSAHALGVTVEKGDTPATSIATMPPSTQRSVTGSAVPPSGRRPWWPWTAGAAGIGLVAAGAAARLRRVRAARTAIT
jgi:hypothetical protein